MKTILASALGLALLAATSLAQVTATETVTTAPAAPITGTITSFDPAGSLVLTSDGAVASPVTYAYSKETTIVDEAGNPVAVDVVKSGVPVTVYYTQSGGQMIASKLVVRHPVAIEKTTTTTTTTTR